MSSFTFHLITNTNNRCFILGHMANILANGRMHYLCDVFFHCVIRCDLRTLHTMINPSCHIMMLTRAYRLVKAIYLHETLVNDKIHDYGKHWQLAALYGKHRPRHEKTALNISYHANLLLIPGSLNILNWGKCMYTKWHADYNMFYPNVKQRRRNACNKLEWLNCYDIRLCSVETAPN